MQDYYLCEILGVKCDNPIYKLPFPWYKGLVLCTNLLHVVCFLNHCLMTTL